LGLVVVERFLQVEVVFFEPELEPDEDEEDPEDWEPDELTDPE
jgi:hypothetical protein